MSDLDLYDDLLTETGQGKQGVPDEKYKALVAENETLKKELEASRNECETLKRNVNSLLATARAELERRDNLFRDLQNRYDALVFRRSGGQPSERPVPLPPQPKPINLKALANPQNATPAADDTNCETPPSRDEERGRPRERTPPPPEASSRSNVRQFSARVGQVKIEQSRASRTPPQSVERCQQQGPIKLDGTDKDGWTHHGKLAIRRIPAEEKDDGNRSNRDSSGEARSKPTTSFDSPKSIASAKNSASQNRPAVTTNEAKEPLAKLCSEIPGELSIARVTVTKSNPQSAESGRDQAKKPEKLEHEKCPSKTPDTKAQEVQKKNGGRAGSKDTADRTNQGKDRRENDRNCKQEASVPSAGKKPPPKSTPVATTSASSTISSHHFMHFLASPDDSKSSNGTSIAAHIETSPASKRKRASKTRSRGVARRNRDLKKNAGSAKGTEVTENKDEVGYLSDTDSIFEAHPSLLEPPSPFPLCKMADPPPSEEAPAENPIDEGKKNDQMFTKPKQPVEVEEKAKKEVAKKPPSVPDPMDKVGQIMNMMKASHQAGCMIDVSKQNPTMDFPRNLERSPVLGPGAGMRQSSSSPLMRSRGANVADPARTNLVGESRKDDGRRIDGIPKLGRDPSPLARTSEPSKDPRLPGDRGQRTSSGFRRPSPSDRLSSTSGRKTTDVDGIRGEKPSPKTFRRPSSPERRSSSSDRYKTEVKDGVMVSKQSSSSSLHHPSSDRRNAEAFNEKTSESQQPSSRKPNESLCPEKDVSSPAVPTKTASDPTSELPVKSEGQRTETRDGLSSSGSGMSGTIPPRRAGRRRVTLSSSGVKIAAVIEPRLDHAEIRAEKNEMNREQLAPEQKKPISITVKPVMKSDGNPRAGEFPANVEEENLIKPTEPESQPSAGTVLTSSGTKKEDVSSPNSRKRLLEATPVALPVSSTDASPSSAGPPSAKRRRRGFNLSSSGVIVA